MARAASEPAVPGANGEYPQPNHVASWRASLFIAVIAPDPGGVPRLRLVLIHTGPSQSRDRGTPLGSGAVAPTILHLLPAGPGSGGLGLRICPWPSCPGR